MFCYSDDVDKELKYDPYISISSTDSQAPIQKNSVVPKKRHPKFGDPLETILMALLQSVFCASTTQLKMAPSNHHLLININHLRFSLGHQGLPRLPQSLRKPPVSTPQQGVRGYSEGEGGKAVQGSPWSEERSLS